MPGGKVTNPTASSTLWCSENKVCASNSAISGGFAELSHFLYSRTSLLLQDFKLTGAG